MLIPTSKHQCFEIDFIRERNLKKAAFIARKEALPAK
jgi:hypothetical protein